MNKSKSRRKSSRTKPSRRKSLRRKPSRRKPSRRKSSKRKSSRRVSKSKDKLKLVKIVKSPKKEKKYRAYFSNGKHTDFGAAGYSDFIKHKDPARKERYIKRHRSRENWKDPTTAGALSLYILWNKPTFRASVADYKRRFKL